MVISDAIKVEMVPLKDLMIPRYQRQCTSTIHKMAAAWDPVKCGMIRVSHRNGRYYVVDGQHRVQAARLAKQSHILAMIVEGAGEAEEVEMFTGQLDNVTRLSWYDRLFAQYQIQENPGYEIFCVLELYGVDVANATRAKPGTLTCLGTVQYVHKKHGVDGLCWVFDTIDRLGWRYAKNGLSSAVIAALGNVYGSFADHTLSKRRVVASAKPFTPEEMLRAAMNAYHYGPSFALTEYWSALIREGEEKSMSKMAS